MKGKLLSLLGSFLAPFRRRFAKKHTLKDNFYHYFEKFQIAGSVKHNDGPNNVCFGQEETGDVGRCVKKQDQQQVLYIQSFL